MKRLSLAAILAFAVSSCEAQLAGTAWSIESEIDYYNQLFVDRPLVRDTALRNLGYAPYVDPYQHFISHYPIGEPADSYLVYYEVAVNAGHYLFYWSGMNGGHCAAFYASSDVEYRTLEGCRFPMTPTAMPDVTPPDRAAFDGMFVGLVIAQRDGQFIRRYAINPNLPIGIPRDEDMARKIESVAWH